MADNACYHLRRLPQSDDGPAQGQSHSGRVCAQLTGRRLGALYQGGVRPGARHRGVSVWHACRRPALLKMAGNRQWIWRALVLLCQQLGCHERRAAILSEGYAACEGMREMKRRSTALASVGVDGWGVQAASPLASTAT